jgi:DNA primase
VKSRSLYGIWFAKNEMSRQDKCILVEGYLDVLSMHQLGIRNVVASSGTSLTVEQIRLIRKFTNNVTIIYDGDSAGIKAALRGIGLVLKEGLNVKVVLLPEGQDPDDFARRHTLEEVQDHIARNEQDFIAFKTDLLLGEAGNDPLKRATLINDIADTISLIPDAVMRAVYVQTCAGKFDIDEQILTDRVSRSRTDMLLADRKEAERARQREENRAAAAQGGDVPPPPSYDDYIPADEDVPPMDMPAVPVAEENGIVLNEPYLAPCEKELLEFILEEGCTELEFDRDSKFYMDGETVNVAEFIDGILADDDMDFVNVPYRKVYEEYFRMYDEGLTQEQIQKRLMDCMDMEIAAVAKDLLIGKYQLTVKNYELSLTAPSTRLVMYVPKTLLTYQLKKVELFQKELTAELARTEDPERQFEIMTRIGEYNKARTRINNELGRV